MDDGLKYFLIVLGILALILPATIAWCCWCSNWTSQPRRQADDQRGSGMIPPNNGESQNQAGLRKRTKDGSSSSEEDRYSSRETVAMDDIASGSENQSGKSNKKPKGQSQAKGYSRTRSVSENEGLYVVYLANNESPEDTVRKYYMSSDNRIKIKKVGKKEEGDTDGEPDREKSRYEECHCMASEININNSACGSGTQDFNEDGKTVIKNDGKCENSSKNLDSVDSDKCCKDFAGRENNSEVESIDQYYSAEDLSFGDRIG